MLYYVLTCLGLMFSFSATMADRVYRNGGPTPTSIHIVDGCYTVANTKTCPREIQGYLPVGSEDVLFVGPTGISIPSQHTSQQVGQMGHPGKGDKAPSQRVIQPGTVIIERQQKD